MLQKKMEEYITNAVENQPLVEELTLILFKEEKDYINRHGLIPENRNITLLEKDSSLRFKEAYIERSDKETEELIAEEGPSFLTQPLEYLNKNQREFVYLESEWFDLTGVDGVSLEVDDVFMTYNVLLGLKLQKKYESPLKDFLETHLNGEVPKYSLMFNQNDGLWDVNFTLNYVEGFNKEMLMEEAYTLIYRFIFTLVEEVEVKP
ncbi:hypothetical protein JOC86_000551 [Bacillus pakistanensis]|uniref:Branched-chain amino acid aminotransferase n=1 Tax=Rossellomorea pakistanensis TaxID=992288 RepID=A0ABS2N8C8_9BACI|nr:branched-chain amino acid aminotransferase [Bacillus pakistanensis]MBM7584014.1 hypothetical protein [Bacillus pakistanensis]